MTNEKTPKVSIVVPCYNVAAFLTEALESLMSQTLREIEILCVNDGSKDDTLEVLRRYADHDSRIRVLDRENGGYGKAMNIGMQAATGEYVGILESDDYVAPDMYETLYAAAKKYDADFVRSDFYKFWTREDGSREFLYEHLTPKREYYGALLNPQEDLDLFNAQMLNWTGIYKASFLSEHNICHNESPGASYQDNGFWFQTYCWATRVVFVDKAFYHYRQDNAASSINQNNKVFCMLDEYSFIKNFLESDSELKERFTGIYHYKKTHNLNFAFSLLAEQFQMPFLQRYAAEYVEARDKGELDETLFYPDEWENLQLIMSDPSAYCAAYNRKRKDERAFTQACARGAWGKLGYYLKREGLCATAKRVIRKMTN